jgi:hypothetical protein
LVSGRIVLELIAIKAFGANIGELLVLLEMVMLYKESKFEWSIKPITSDGSSNQQSDTRDSNNFLALKASFSSKPLFQSRNPIAFTMKVTIFVPLLSAGIFAATTLAMPVQAGDAENSAPMHLQVKKSEAAEMHVQVKKSEAADMHVQVKKSEVAPHVQVKKSEAADMHVQV